MTSLGMCARLGTRRIPEREHRGEEDTAGSTPFLHCYVRVQGTIRVVTRPVQARNELLENMIHSLIS